MYNFDGYRVRRFEIDILTKYSRFDCGFADINESKSKAQQSTSFGSDEVNRCGNEKPAHHNFYTITLRDMFKWKSCLRSENRSGKKIDGNGIQDAKVMFIS